MNVEHGFPPVYDERSEVLILGSFPSVKSREEGFYYGNPRNRFWGILSSFFGEEPPAGIPAKRDFLLRRHIALWDAVSSCEITLSRDESIRGQELSPVAELLKTLSVKAVLCNGAAAYKLFSEEAGEFLPLARRLPSTSPRNAACRDLAEIWHAALREVFGDFPEKP